MASPLDKMQAQIAKGFKGKLKVGKIRRVPVASLSAGTGDPVAGTALIFNFEGIRENFSAWFRAQAGIPETDVSVLVILGLVNPATVPLEDDEVFIENQWHKTRRVLAIDPASATARLQVYEIPDPTV